MGNVLPSALRQPPPPGRCLLVDSNKVSAPSTSKAEGDISRVRSRQFYFQRCKEANPSNSMIESLPDELLMEILACIPAIEIYDNARLVCRRWRHLVHTDVFVREHLHRSSSGLLLVPPYYMQNPPIFVTATAQGRVEISELSCRVNSPILCSCNGLALCLWEDDFGCRIPFIFNPATKCAFYLPRFPVTVIGNLVCRLGMAYAAASMAYKVFESYEKLKKPHFAMLTVGVDKAWRHVSVEGLSPEARLLIMGHCGPLIAGCFVHWVSETCVVSLNVETEIFTETPTPTLMFPQGTKKGYYPLSTGECLSLLISCGDWSWEVWEMKPETREWRKVLPNINLEAGKWKCKTQRARFLQTCRNMLVFIKPAGWVRYLEVLAILDSIGGSCIIYHLDTHEIDSFELSTPAKDLFVVQHRNSLVWLEKC